MMAPIFYSSTPGPRHQSTLSIAMLGTFISFYFSAFCLFNCVAFLYAFDIHVEKLCRADRQFGTDYMASLMAQSGYDAIAISETDFFDGPATLSDYMTRLVTASVSAPTFLASKYAHLSVSRDLML